MAGQLRVDEITDEAGTGSPSFPVGASIQGLTVGRGAGAVATNTAVGLNAFASNSVGVNNTAIGSLALNENISNHNTAVGNQALRNNINSSNTAIGTDALLQNTTGTNNNATGRRALENNTTGSSNTATGRDALRSNTTGSLNTAVGQSALVNNTTGNDNTAIGSRALLTSSGSNNIAIGVDAGRASSPRDIAAQNNEIVIGNNNHTGAFIRIAFTVTSDARDKAALAPIPHGLAFVNALQPTEYQFKAGGRDGAPDGHRRYGFLAQDVLAAEGDNPVIVNNDDPDSLKMTHDYLIPVLVNAIKELKAEIDVLKGKA